MTPPPSPTDSPPTPLPAVRPAPRAPAIVPERRGVLSVLSHVARGGDWAVPRLFRALSVMGNVELDLTRARIGAGTCELELVAIMGSIVVRVPPGVHVECEGHPFLGSVEMRGDPPGTPLPGEPAPDAPHVRIVGTAFMGAIDIVIVDPDAAGRRGRLRPRLSPPKPRG